ncbi:MAG: HD domain-containing phosphohydrolase [Pirellulales bacterium]
MMSRNLQSLTAQPENPPVSTGMRESQMCDLLSSIEQAVNFDAASDQGISPASADLPARSKIMMVDDEQLNILVVAEYLKAGGYHDLVFTDDPLQALSLAVREQPDAILLDLHMSRLSGFDVLQLIRADHVLAWVPVIILTSSTDGEEKLRALELGATDFLQKPLNSGELLVRLRNILMAKAYQNQWRDYSRTLADAVRQRTADLEASRLEVIHCLARAGEFRDDDTGHHVIRVGRYARLIGQQLGMDERCLDVLEQAAKLHDIGKIGIPDSILRKDGALTPQEFDSMQRHSNYGKNIIEGMQQNEAPQLRQHTELGAKILDAARSPILTLAMRIALTHHERWDGTGYPLGLAGEDIPLEGRITAVADVFDALSTKRCYKPAFSLERCFAIMRDGRGTHFDPRVLDAFLERRDDIVQTQISDADVR